MDDLCLRPAVELLAGLRDGRTRSRELLERYLDRVELLNPRLNAIVTLDAVRARAAADEADAVRARGGSLGPLHGLPMTVKDTIETAGLRSTAGSPLLAQHVPDRDATVVARLRAAGAVIFGKTNTPPFGGDAQTVNPVFGATRNPWHVERTSGGSSGGAAAAVAAGLSAAEVGSDIGGSIRNPAHCCGVYGHKPTHGIVPMRGHLPPEPGSLARVDLAVLGPIARSAGDVALLLDVLAGPDEPESEAYELRLPAPRRASLREYRVAAWLDDPFCPVDSAVRDSLEAAVAALRRSGVAVDDAARPVDLGTAHRCYERLLWPILAGGSSPEEVAELDRVAAGGASGDAGLVDRVARAVALRHRDWLAVDGERQRIRASFADFFRRFDVLLCPVLPVPAFPHDHQGTLLTRTLRVNGTDREYLDLIVWPGLANLALLPATAAPVGRTADGLPVGLQVIGPFLEDRTTIDFTRRLAEVVGGYEPPADA